MRSGGRGEIRYIQEGRSGHPEYGTAFTLLISLHNGHEYVVPFEVLAGQKPALQQNCTYVKQLQFPVATMLISNCQSPEHFKVNHMCVVSKQWSAQPYYKDKESGEEKQKQNPD